MHKIKSYLHWLVLPILFMGQASFAKLPSHVLPSLAPMLENVTPAVVNISSTTSTKVNNPLLNDPFFRHFFNIPELKQDKQSRGSGVIINARAGYVVTNHHVVNKADEISVKLLDGRDLNAKLIGADPETDIALLKVSAKNLTALSLANSEHLRVGDFVVAIGNPFGLGQTVTSGIISALGRSGLGIEGYEDFIQTDASINPGNSGGGLVNLRGELIGINTAILAPSGGNVGIGFAIPSNMVNKVIQHLVKFGEVRRGSLGVQIQNLTPKLANAFRLKSNKGAVVVKVDRGSAAAKAGLRSGDIIIAVNNKTVKSAADLRNYIGLLQVGERIKIKIVRNRRTYNLTAVIGDIKRVKGEEINWKLKGALLNDTNNGIQIHKVTKNSNAWRLGIRKADIIIGFNRRKVKDLAELTQRFKRYKPRSIQINRNDRTISVWLQ